MERKNAFEKYIDEIGHASALSVEEEESLARRIADGDARALDRLSRANLKFVVAMANSFRGKGVDISDLVSEGNMALLKAARKYKPGHGSRFVSYASPFIRKAMEAAIVSQSGLYKVPQDNDTPQERKRARALSVDAPLGGRENVTLLTVVADPDSPVPGADDGNDDAQAMIVEKLHELPEREQKVIRLLFGIDGDRYTMAEAAQMMGLKRERVRQIRDRALRRIRK